MKQQHLPGRDAPPNSHGNYPNLPPPRFPPNGYKYPAHGMRHPALFARGMYPPGIFHPDNRFQIPPLLAMNVTHHGGRPPNRMSGYMNPFQHAPRAYHPQGGRSPTRVPDHSLHYGSHSGNRSPNRGLSFPSHTVDRKPSYENKPRSRSPTVVQSRSRSPAVPIGGGSPSRLNSGKSPPRPSSGGKSPSRPSSGGMSPSKNPSNNKLQPTTSSGVRSPAKSAIVCRSPTHSIHKPSPTSVIRNATVTSSTLTSSSNERSPLRLTISTHSISSVTNKDTGDNKDAEPSPSGVPTSSKSVKSSGVDATTSSAQAVITSSKPFPNVIKISGLGSIGAKIAGAGFSSQILPLKKRICTAFAMEQDTGPVPIKPTFDLNNLEGKHLHVLTDPKTDSAKSSDTRSAMMGLPATLPRFVINSPPRDWSSKCDPNVDVKDAPVSTRKRKSRSQKDRSPVEKKFKAHEAKSKNVDSKDKFTPTKALSGNQRKTRSQTRSTHPPEKKEETNDLKEGEKNDDAGSEKKATPKSKIHKPAHIKVVEVDSSKDMNEKARTAEIVSSKTKRATPSKIVKKVVEFVAPQSNDKNILHKQSKGTYLQDKTKSHKKNTPAEDHSSQVEDESKSLLSPKIDTAQKLKTTSTCKTELFSLSDSIKKRKICHSQKNQPRTLSNKTEIRDDKVFVVKNTNLKVNHVTCADLSSSLVSQMSSSLLMQGHKSFDKTYGIKPLRSVTDIITSKRGTSSGPVTRRTRSKRIEFLKNTSPTISSILEHPGPGIAFGIPIQLPQFPLTIPEALGQQVRSGKSAMMKLPRIPKLPRIMDKSTKEPEIPKSPVIKQKNECSNLTSAKNMRSKTDVELLHSPENTPDIHMKNVKVKICRLSPKALGEKKTASASKVEKQACPITSPVSSGPDLGSPTTQTEMTPHISPNYTHSTHHTDVTQHSSGLLEDLLWQVQKGYFLRRGAEEATVSIEEAASVTQAVSCDRNGKKFEGCAIRSQHTPQGVVTHTYNAPQKDLSHCMITETPDSQTPISIGVDDFNFSAKKVDHQTTGTVLLERHQSDDDLDPLDLSDTPLIIDIPPDEDEHSSVSDNLKWQPSILEDSKEEDSIITNIADPKPGLKTVIRVPKTAPKRGRKGRRKSWKKSACKIDISESEISHKQEQNLQYSPDLSEIENMDNGKDSGIESAGVPDQLKEINGDKSENTEYDKSKDMGHSGLACRKKTNITGAVIYSTSSMLKSTARVKAKSRGIDDICASLVSKKVANQQASSSAKSPEASLADVSRESLRTDPSITAEDPSKSEIPQTMVKKTETSKKSETKQTEARSSKVKRKISKDHLANAKNIVTQKIPNADLLLDKFTKLKTDEETNNPIVSKTELSVDNTHISLTKVSLANASAIQTKTTTDITSSPKLKTDSPIDCVDSSLISKTDKSLDNISAKAEQLTPEVPTKGRTCRAAKRKALTNISKASKENADLIDTESPTKLSQDSEREQPLQTKKKRGRPSHSRSHVSESTTFPSPDTNKPLTLSTVNTTPLKQSTLLTTGHVDTSQATTPIKIMTKRRGRTKKTQQIDAEYPTMITAAAEPASEPVMVLSAESDVPPFTAPISIDLNDHQIVLSKKTDETNNDFSPKDASLSDSSSKKFFTSHRSRSKLSPPYKILSGLLSPGKTSLSPSYNAHPMGSASKKLKQPAVKPSITIYDFDDDDEGGDDKDDGKQVAQNNEKQKIPVKSANKSIKGKRGRKPKSQQKTIEVPELEDKSEEEDYMPVEPQQPQSRFLRPRSKVNYNENETEQPKRSSTKIAIGRLPTTTVNVKKSSMSLKIKIPRISVEEHEQELEAQFEAPSPESEGESSFEQNIEENVEAIPQRAPQLPTMKRHKKRQRKTSCSNKMTVTSETISITTNEVTQIGSDTDDDQKTPVMMDPKLDDPSGHMSSGICQGCQDGTCSTTITTRRVRFRLVKIGQGLWKTVSVIEDPVTDLTTDEVFQSTPTASESSSSDKSLSSDDKSKSDSDCSSRGSDLDMPELDDSAAYDQSNNESDRESTSSPPVLQKTPPSAGPRVSSRKSYASSVPSDIDFKQISSSAAKYRSKLNDSVASSAPESEHFIVHSSSEFGEQLKIHPDSRRKLHQSEEKDETLQSSSSRIIRGFMPQDQDNHAPQCTTPRGLRRPWQEETEILPVPSLGVLQEPVHGTLPGTSPSLLQGLVQQEHDVPSCASPRVIRRPWQEDHEQLPCSSPRVLRGHVQLEQVSAPVASGRQLPEHKAEKANENTHFNSSPTFDMKRTRATCGRKLEQINDFEIDGPSLSISRYSKDNKTLANESEEVITTVCSPRFTRRRKSEQSKGDFEGFVSPNCSPRGSHGRKSLPDVAAQCFSPRLNRRRTSDYMDDNSEIEQPAKRVLRSQHSSEAVSVHQSSGNTDGHQGRQRHCTSSSGMDPDLFPPILESFDGGRTTADPSQHGVGKTSQRSSPRLKYLACVEDISSDEDDDEQNNSPPKLENMLAEDDLQLLHGRRTRSQANKLKDEAKNNSRKNFADFAVPTPPPRYAPENVLEEAIQFDSEMSQSSCSTPSYPIVSPLTLSDNKSAGKDNEKKSVDEVEELDFADSFLNGTRTLSAEIEEQIQKQQLQLQQQQAQQSNDYIIPPIEVAPFAPDFQDMDYAYDLGLIPMATTTNGAVYGALNPSEISTVGDKQAFTKDVPATGMLNTPKGKGDKKSDSKRRSSKSKSKKNTATDKPATSVEASRTDNEMDKLLGQHGPESTIGFALLDDFDESAFGVSNTGASNLDDLFGASLLDQMPTPQSTDFGYVQPDIRGLSSNKDTVLQCVDVIGETKMVVHRPGGATPRRPHHGGDICRQGTSQYGTINTSNIVLHTCHCGAQFTDDWSYQEHEVFCSGPQLFGL